VFEDVKDEIIKFGKIAGDRNLTPGISGNISVRCGDKIVITSSGSASSFLTYNDLCVIDFDGNVVEGSKKASSEKFVHIEFYKKRENVGAICHFHSPYLTSFAACNQPLKEKVLPEIVFMFGEIPVAPYAIPGSKLLADETAQYFDNYTVVLMQNHGAIAGGKDLKEAYLNIELCEAYAKTLLFSKILGGAKILSESQTQEIYSLKN
jgi:L-fuculose-phosphate aldolase